MELDEDILEEIRRAVREDSETEEAYRTLIQSEKISFDECMGNFKSLDISVRRSPEGVSIAVEKEGASPVLLPILMCGVLKKLLTVPSENGKGPCSRALKRRLAELIEKSMED